MRHALLVLKLVVWLYLAYVTIFLLTSYAPQTPGYAPPALLWILDIINLFIHEAGHLFFKIFGMWLHIIAGSLFQVALPLALAIVTARHRLSQVGYPAFWVGESLVNVSVYIKDAPYKHLRLIARGLIHDWNWLLSGNLEAAEPLGEIAYWLGILLCIGSVTGGAYFAVRTWRHPEEIPVGGSED